LIAAEHHIAQNVTLYGSDLTQAMRQTPWQENVIAGGGAVKEGLISK
jgi:hypothetical protein